MRNFSPSVEGYALSVAGPPAYAQRLRQIEDEIEDHLDRLRAARDELRREVRDPVSGIDAGASSPLGGTSMRSTT